MRTLLRRIAKLPHVCGILPVQMLADEASDGICLLRTAASPAVEVAALHDGSDDGRREAEGIARILSGAPVMLDLLASVLVRWGKQVEADTEIDGSEAVDWLSQFAVEVRDALRAIVASPQAGTAP